MPSRVDIALRSRRHRVGVQLRRHVRDVAHPDVDLANHRVIALDDAGEPEVRDLDVAVRVDQQLLRLHAPVVDALRVRGLERVQRLEQILERELDRNLLGVVDQPARRAVRRELGDEERILDPQVDVVDRQDVRVREVAPRAHDIGEPAHDLVALILAEEPEQIANLFERDLAIQRDLAGAIDRAHAARADRRELLVANFARGHLDVAGDHRRRPSARRRDLCARIFARQALAHRAFTRIARHRARLHAGLAAHRHRGGRHGHRPTLAQLLEVTDRALGKLGEVTAVHDGLALGRDLEALARSVVAQVSGLLQEPDVLRERDRDRAFTDAADIVVAVLAAIARLGHDVREDEASLFAEDFLRDLGTAFHTTDCRHPSSV